MKKQFPSSMPLVKKSSGVAFILTSFHVRW